MFAIFEQALWDSVKPKPEQTPRQSDKAYNSKLLVWDRNVKEAKRFLQGRMNCVAICDVDVLWVKQVIKRAGL